VKNPGREEALIAAEVDRDPLGEVAQSVESSLARA
jgi:hypothetical protein